MAMLGRVKTLPSTPVVSLVVKGSSSSRAQRLSTARTASVRQAQTTSNEGGLPEKYGNPERPLRLVLVGHNPSAAAWKSHHYYANPSNRMWKLLSGVGILPATYTFKDDDLCAATHGIGFTDLGHGIPGTDSSQFKATVLHSWRASLYQRLQAHAVRAGGAPKVIAFTGKRQFAELFFDHPLHKARAISYGQQNIRPEGWPFAVEEVIVFVLTSSSGAAAMSNAAREAPYRELAALLQQFPWEPPAGSDDEAPKTKRLKKQ